ncbi:TnsA endonuclease N-terminal domain-containing protein [Chromobacterium violaceum]|uniref:TnsA endonuclease N-terminal domain-containing protein n=1 Tax=Chromobacterium violaceum TaxID=536 RepID=UPI0009DA49CF|nr:TnsA endonuclease N-terminal domain-containing protein [Chromobacterium violaceum]OQS30421.1 hypothetical protein B0T41_00245 [Chromobacterium violaceum]
MMNASNLTPLARSLALVYQPARRVVAPTGGIIRGRFPSTKAGRMLSFEQLLERDALYLFEFCPLVVEIREQPFRFHYSDGCKVRRYTPDFALTLKDGSQVIVEVKPARSLARPDIQAKIMAIQEAMKRQGYRYLILSDSTIRQEPRLENLKCLHPYLRHPISLEQRLAVRNLPGHGNPLSIEQCALSVGSFSAVLTLVAHGMLRVDYFQPIRSSSLVSLSQAEVDHALVDWL